MTHRSAQVGAVAGEPTGQDSSRALLKVAWQFQKGWTHHISIVLSVPMNVRESDKGYRVPRGCAMVDGSSVVFDDLWKQQHPSSVGRMTDCRSSVLILGIFKNKKL